MQVKFCCPPLHGPFDAPQQVPCPHDAASNWGGVPRPRRVLLLALVQLLHRPQVGNVGVEDHLVLAFQFSLSSGKRWWWVARAVLM